MVDVWVQKTQAWLNATYGQVDGWVPLTENGLTGWATIYGLRRGLQHELGISPVTSGFGPATTAAFISQIGAIGTATTSENLLRLVSGSLWCKGLAGTTFGTPITFASIAGSVSTARTQLGLSSPPIIVDVKMMASLMSMDAYTTLSGQGGTDGVREVEQWLNATYSTRENFALVPCDGVFSRQIQTAVLYGLQYEFGMNDATANGNFGPGTQAGLRSQAPVATGSSDSTHHFVHLFQGLLRFNGYGSTPFTGSFDAATATQVSTFQSFMALASNGKGDYGTWCALLVSSGDPNRAVSGFDTAQQLTPAQASAAANADYSHVGRYLVGSGKFITGADLLNDKQKDRLDTLFADDAHVEVEVTWSVYQRMIAAYRHENRRHGRELMARLIDSISTGVPKALVEITKLGRTLKKRAADVLAYFDRPSTSNGPNEAINGRLEHLRGSALGFRNLTNYIARSLLETGGFRPRLHPGFG
ncbi:transposase [Propionibacterium freudenreichii]|nr:transposase [Propionibacterium freudenreichii]